MAIKDKLAYIGFGILGALIIPTAVANIYQGLRGHSVFDGHRIPQIEQVQQGYVSPSKLEIFCKDLDGNGEPETLMRVGNQNYLLREVDGKPVLSAYEIKPVEVVPKN